jgi:hypothetical protein
LTPWLEEAHIEARNAVTARLKADELAKIERNIETMSLAEAIDEALRAAAADPEGVSAS